MTDFTSRTARAPTRHYKRRLAISEHAIERFRERVDEEFRHRDDSDLGNLLDERLGYAEFNYQVHDLRAPEEITTLRSVACRHATYYAVVRNETAITVLDEEMARKNFDRWTPVEITTQGPKPPTPPRLPALPILPVQPPPALSAPQSPAATPSGPTIEDPLVSVIAAGVPVTPAPAPEDPLEAAGITYARARKQQIASAAVVAALKAELDRAAEALLEAELVVEDAHRRLIELAGKGEP